MTPKIPLPSLAKVYITNVCNLTCDQCNRFNNFDFKGWQRWSDYAEQYQRWSEIFKLDNLTILGGEPLLNPDIVAWIRGLGTAFDVPIQVRTNGIRLNQVKGLYDAIADARPTSGGRNYIAMSLHNHKDFPVIRKNILSFLQGDVKQTQENSALTFLDSNGVRIVMQMLDEFVPAGIQNPSPGRYTLNNSDPIEAHKVCGFVKYKSYQFSKAKLYKCPPAELRPEFDLQHRLDISDEDRALLNAYRPLTLDNFDEYHQEFLANLDNPIPQCKFCSSDTTRIKIIPIRKGTIK